MKRAKSYRSNGGNLFIGYQFLKEQRNARDASAYVLARLQAMAIR